MPAQNKKQTTLWTSPDEKAAITSAAAAENVSASEFLRRAAAERVRAQGGEWPGDTAQRGKYDRTAAAKRRRRKEIARLRNIAEPSDVVQLSTAKAIKVARQVLPDKRISGDEGAMTAALEANTATIWKMPNGEYIYDEPAHGACALALMIYDHERGQLVMDDSD